MTGSSSLQAGDASLMYVTWVQHVCDMYASCSCYALIGCMLLQLLWHVVYCATQHWNRATPRHQVPQLHLHMRLRRSSAAGHKRTRAS